MQSARITPRTIHFQDAIEIREIPRKDSEELASAKEFGRQSSWDPDLTDVIYFDFLNIQISSWFFRQMYLKNQN